MTGVTPDSHPVHLLQLYDVLNMLYSVGFLPTILSTLDNPTAVQLMPPFSSLTETVH